MKAMTTKFSVRPRLAIAGLMLSGLLVGCGKAKEPWEVAYPTQGVIKYQGKPLANAQITLVPEDADFPDTVRPRGYTKEDGTFQLSTYSEGDGAPEGKYKVLAMRFPVVGPKESPSQAPNNLPRKYASPDTTDLKVEVQADKTELSPLELRR